MHYKSFTFNQNTKFIWHRLLQLLVQNVDVQLRLIAVTPAALLLIPAHVEIVESLFLFSIVTTLLALESFVYIRPAC